LEYIDHSLYYNNTLFEEKYNAIMGVLNEKMCKYLFFISISLLFAINSYDELFILTLKSKLLDV
jgi:hypothetical protein